MHVGNSLIRKQGGRLLSDTGNHSHLQVDYVMLRGGRGQGYVVFDRKMVCNCWELDARRMCVEGDDGVRGNRKLFHQGFCSLVDEASMQIMWKIQEKRRAEGKRIDKSQTMNG
jgi:hypothetical protein